MTNTYTILKAGSPSVITIDEGSINTLSTSLTLTGKGRTDYGQHRNTNLVGLLENFADSTAPANPTIGQLWFREDVNELRVRGYDSGSPRMADWIPIGSATEGSRFEVGTFTGTGSPPTAYQTTTILAPNPGDPTATNVLVYVNGVHQAEGLSGNMTYDYVNQKVLFNTGSPSVIPEVGDTIVVQAFGIDSALPGSPQVVGVASVFGRMGNVVAVASDYDASQIDNDSGVPGAFVSDALDDLDARLDLLGSPITAGGADVEASGAASQLLRGDGSGGWDDAGANILVDSIGRLNLLQNSFIDSPMQFRVSAGNYTSISSFGTETSISASGTITGLRLSGYDLVEVDGGNLKMFQIAAPQADEGGYGQIWLENTTDQLLQFRDEAGDDWAMGTTSGSFTGTITGCTVNPTGTIEWARSRVDDGNDIIVLSCDVDITGTSNTTQMTMTGIPAALQPTTSRRVACWVRNESKFTCALAEIDSSGVITFYAPDNLGNTTNPFWSFNTFGNTGTKGLENGWTVTYRLD